MEVRMAEIDITGLDREGIEAKIREAVGDLGAPVFAVNVGSTERFPCQATPMADPPPALLRLLYHLLRDELEVGAVEALLLDARKATTEDQYSNPHLEGLARAYCTTLVGEDHEAMELAGRTLTAIREQLEEAGLWVMGDGHEAVARLIKQNTKQRDSAERMNAEITRLLERVRDIEAAEVKAERYRAGLEKIADADVSADSLRGYARSTIGER